jgi:hypothetical protein
MTGHLADIETVYDLRNRILTDLRPVRDFRGRHNKKAFQDDRFNAQESRIPWIFTKNIPV